MLQKDRSHFLYVLWDLQQLEVRKPKERLETTACNDQTILCEEEMIASKEMTVCKERQRGDWHVNTTYHLVKEEVKTDLPSWSYINL